MVVAILKEFNNNINMKQLFQSVLACVAVVLTVTSCSTPKNVAYIQNSEKIDFSQS